jgi:hypothetical protein
MVHVQISVSFFQVVFNLYHGKCVPDRLKLVLTCSKPEVHTLYNIHLPRVFAPVYSPVLSPFSSS